MAEQLGRVCVVGFALLAGCSSGTDPDGTEAGGELVFTRFADRNSFDSDLYIVGLDGSGLRPLLTGPTIDFDPAWSPDGLQLAIGSESRPPADGIYIMDRDGRNLTGVETTTFAARSPAWSPDGLQIAFAAGGCESIYVVNSDGSGLRVLVPSSQLGGGLVDCIRLNHPTWSPDGTLVAFGAWFLGHGGGSTSLWVVNADGTDIRPIRLDPDLSSSSPAWSPEGHRLAFDCGLTLYSPRAICVVDSGGGTPTMLTTGGWDLNPTWAPDGQALAFVRTSPSSGDALMVVGVDGTQPRIVARAPAIHAVSWAPR